MTIDGETEVSAGPTPSLLITQKRVAMADVDAAGILYFAAPYRWLEESFTGWLKALGHPLSSILRSGQGCPCVTSATSYAVPLVLDDDIELTLRPSSVGSTSFSITVEAIRPSDAALALRSTAWHVWSEFDGHTQSPVVAPSPLPDWLREGLSSAPSTSPVRTRTPVESRG
jgi:YbgC/YbaW family acyl-CoA thioester hydrolase